MVTFLCDAMLGDLARALRVFGFDTLYAGDMDSHAGQPVPDHELLQVAKRDDRVILTRDVAFAARDVRVRLVEATPVNETIERLVSDLGIRLIFDQASSRCSRCNEVLVPVPKDSVRGRVKENTFFAFDEFFQCSRCEQVFWKGAHFRDDNGLLSRFQEIVD